MGITSLQLGSVAVERWWNAMSNVTATAKKTSPSLNSFNF